MSMDGNLVLERYRSKRVPLEMSSPTKRDSKKIKLNENPEQIKDKCKEQEAQQVRRTMNLSANGTPLRKSGTSIFYS